MKKCIIVIIGVLFCFLGAHMLSASPNTWTKKADFGGTARYGAVGFSIGSKGYIGTGWDELSYKVDFWEYNPATSAWTQKANFLGAARYYAAGFSIGSKGYIGTGYDDLSFYKDFWEYNPAANTWTQKADFGGAPRAYAAGFSIGGKGYIGTGYDESEQKDFWEYNPAANTWTPKDDFGGTARDSVVGFSIGRKGYMGTGCDDSYPGTKGFWEYDPAANIWTQKADFEGAARSYAIGFSLGGKGYIGAGWNDSIVYKDFWEYDPAANIWTQKADFGGTARDSAVGFSIGGKGYVGMGYDDGYVYQKDFWEYEPVSPFTDVPSIYWAYDYIMTIYNAGYTTGAGAGTFAPELNVNREQMAAFIVRAKEGEPPQNYCSTDVPFLDIGAGSWSCGYIKRLFELGITTGYGDGRYGPDDLVTRAQMAAFIVRAVEGEPANGYCSSGVIFPDVIATDLFCGYIKRFYELGITTGYGDGRYGPDDLVTRAQMAVFLGRAFLGM